MASGALGAQGDPKRRGDHHGLRIGHKRFLVTSELTESKASIRSFVKEIKVRPGKATIRYIPPYA